MLVVVNASITQVLTDSRMCMIDSVITSVRLSRTGDSLFSVGQDTSLKIYSSKHRKLLRNISMCELVLSSCQLTADEQFVILGSWDNSMYATARSCALSLSLSLSPSTFRLTSYTRVILIVATLLVHHLFVVATFTPFHMAV
jgi:WD40 repeat protein